MATAPVVFVHGAIDDFRQWEPQRRAIAERHRFVAYSPRYHWPNAWAGDGSDYSYEVHAADLAAFVAGPVHLVGHSYGGSVAMLMASTTPLLHVVNGRVGELEVYKDDLSRVIRKPRPEDMEIIVAGDGWTSFVTT